MGRPPCCEKVGVKKGSWTPEEDIILVSYVQQHGPGNWRAVPSTTGLRRCSKSCRLRWTNYLRPGIKRGSFTNQEEKMIIQLQALLGNKWAAIASYLPERTDNDIKNYWNTHLKKKLKRLSILHQSLNDEDDNNNTNTNTNSNTNTNDLSLLSSNSNSKSKSHSISRGQWEKRLQDDITTAKQALHDALSSADSPPPAAAVYASSTQNIAKLLKNWVKNTPHSAESKSSSNISTTVDDSASASASCRQSLTTNCDDRESAAMAMDHVSEAFQSIFGFDSLQPSNSDEFSRSASPRVCVGAEIKQEMDSSSSLSMLESWLIDFEVKDYLI